MTRSDVAGFGTHPRVQPGRVSQDVFSQDSAVISAMGRGP